MSQEHLLKMSDEMLQAAISKAEQYKFAEKYTVDWGPRPRGQGRRFGKMVGEQPTVSKTESVERVRRLVGALTPSAETKSAYMGEFTFDTWFQDTKGRDWRQCVTVPWTTIKKIMKAIRERAAHDARIATPLNLVPVYPGPDLQRGDIVYTPTGQRAEVWNIDEDKGTFTSQGQFCASVLRREALAPQPGGMGEE